MMLWMIVGLGTSHFWLGARERARAGVCVFVCLWIHVNVQCQCSLRRGHCLNHSPHWLG